MKRAHRVYPEERDSFQFFDYCRLPQAIRKHVISYMDANDRIAMKFCSKSTKKDIDDCKKNNLYEISIDSKLGRWRTKLTKESEFEMLKEEDFYRIVRKVDNIEQVFINNLDSPDNIFVDKYAYRKYLKDVKYMIVISCQTALPVLKQVKPGVLKTLGIYCNKAEGQLCGQTLELQQVISADDLYLRLQIPSDEHFLKLTAQTMTLFGDQIITRQALNKFLKKRSGHLNERYLYLEVPYGPDNVVQGNGDERLIVRGFNRRRKVRTPYEKFDVLETILDDVKITYGEQSVVMRRFRDPDVELTHAQQVRRIFEVGLGFNS